MTQTPERNKSLLQLAVLSRPAIDNPITMAIIEAAPSPSSADEYMQQLGWSNAVAATVRNGVRIKEQYPNAWPDVWQSAARSLESLFDFSPDPQVAERLQCMDDERAIHFKVQTCAKMAGDSAQVNLPLLFRQWLFQRTDHTDTVVNTFDGTNDGYAVNRSRVSSTLGHLFDGRPLIKVCYPRPEAGSGSKWQYWLPGQDSNYSMTLPRITINLMPPTVIAAEGRYPEFYKLVEISSRLPVENSVTQFDRFRIMIRIDRAPKLGPSGTMDFDRVVAVLGTPKEKSADVPVIRAHRKWVINADCNAVSVPDEDWGPSIIADFERGGLGGYRSKVGDAVKLLTPVLETLIQFERISLGIFDQGFLLDPPSNLLELLTEGALPKSKE